MNIVRKVIDESSQAESLTMLSDDGITEYSSMAINTVSSRYCGKYISTLTIGGIATPAPYRRRGYVRALLEDVFEEAPERGWVVSMLHPFSFSYYRKFGYEKIADHKILEFPLSALDFTPRYSDLVLVNDPSYLADLITVYNEFGNTRGILFSRNSSACFVLKPSPQKSTYIYYSGIGKPEGYAVIGIENYFDTNRMISVYLHVYELVFNTPNALCSILGFLRMYEGEKENVKLHNCAMAPEIDAVLRHYMQTKYTLVPDIAGRILNVSSILSSASYPTEHGSFTVRVHDTLSFTDGAYLVEYQNGQSDVKKLSSNAECDIESPMPAFTAMIYGYESYSTESSIYLPGVRINRNADNFFRVFNKKFNGLFEHF